ncbi:hypothetical protein LU196_15350 [Pantoea sp. Mb-10]|uniref:hypothetical protein n=1 Tax=unclassified Pantoea TaxID=2630326 RepID=UPI001E46D400|nr:MULTISPECIES: hypothetical protein [unclassified Pantoea]MCE0491417.1 hypothetical protein [Pantoea sp. Mb-10]MCE0502231.1 hypothetical protein [Pantoea sp. Pb-8]
MKVDKRLMMPFFILLIFISDNASARSIKLSDEQVKQQIIDESIASYPGNCACPFNSARNGSSCGRRSAWSKPGGYAPICYKKEVTKAMIAQWRQSNTTQ